METEDEDKILGLLERLRVNDYVNEDEILSTIVRVTQACHVPCVKKAEDIPYEVSDFYGIVNTAESQLCVICRVLEALCNAKNKGQKFSTLFSRNVMIHCLLVATEYTEIKWEWSSDKTSVAAKNVIEKLCEYIGCITFGGLLTGKPDKTMKSYKQERMDGDVVKDDNYLEFILQRLIEKLNKKEWKAYPASKASYWFILMHLDDRNLGNYLAYMLPPALFIVDDWEQKNKVFGLQCLHHILKNTTGSQIRWYGRAVVIFDAIKSLLHSRDVEVLELLFPTITLVAEILEADPTYTGHLRSISNFDTIMQQLILEMRYEQKLVLRCVYSAAIPGLLNAMGILAIKWSKELIPMFEDYLATFSGPLAEDKINILKGIQVYVRECWPQIHVNASSILKMILRLIYDITDEDSALTFQVTEMLTKEALQVVDLLHAAAPETTQELYCSVEVAEVHPTCQVVLKKIKAIITSDTESIKT